MSAIMINKHQLAAVVSFVALNFAAPAFGAEAVADAGFYGGISMRDRGSDSFGLQSGTPVANWTWLAAPAVEDASTRSLVFGGYRFRNDVAVEASFSSIDKYALRPADLASSRGVGLGLRASALAPADVAARSWNLDVYTSWAFYKTFALYGRLGYAQSDSTPLFTGASLTNGADPRRAREGMNYGVGLRYDVTSDLGLRLEYARFARFGIETGGLLPESDQLSFGVQYRF